jgi:hypothetical protein
MPRVSRRIAAAFLLGALGACRRPPAECTALRDRFLECSPHRDRMTREAADDLQEKCGYVRGDPGSMGGGYERFFTACVTTTGCDGLSACMSTSQCNFILTSPEDDSPALMCPL